MRLIDADEIYEVLTDYYHLRTPIQQKALKEALERLPTIDAVEVVRCKDCKHYDGSYPMCCRWEETIKPDDYCSYGEKKEVEE